MMCTSKLDPTSIFPKQASPISSWLSAEAQYISIFHPLSLLKQEVRLNLNAINIIHTYTCRYYVHVKNKEMIIPCFDLDAYLRYNYIQPTAIYYVSFFLCMSKFLMNIRLMCFILCGTCIRAYMFVHHEHAINKLCFLHMHCVSKHITFVHAVYSTDFVSRDMEGDP